MEIKTRENSSIFVIDVIGDMDLYSSFRLKELVDKLTNENVKKFIINLDEVSYIDSSGVGSLIYINSLCKKKDISFKIVNVKGTVKRVIELTKLLGYLPIANSEEDAVSLLS